MRPSEPMRARQRLSRRTIGLIAAIGIAVAAPTALQLTVARVTGAPVSTPPTFQVNIDQADAATLALLPGIGPALAARIVDDRARFGSFGGVAALERVKGIGPAIASGVEPFVVANPLQD